MSKKISLLDFFEKYYRIKLPDGTSVKPNITDEEKRVFSIAEELGVPPYVRFWKRKIGWTYEIHPEIRKKL